MTISTRFSPIHPFGGCWEISGSIFLHPAPLRGFPFPFLCARPPQPRGKPGRVVRACVIEGKLDEHGQISPSCGRQRQ